MIDFPPDGPGPALARCRTCGRQKDATLQFGMKAGKRDTQCRGCKRDAWTDQRRRRLERRKCNACKSRLPFADFTPVMMRNGRTALSAACNTCRAIRAEEAEHRTARKLGAPRRLPNAGTTRGLGMDCSDVAHVLLYPGTRFRDLTGAQREYLWALTKELARHYGNPPWNPLWDENRSPREKAMQGWARKWLTDHPIPENLFAESTTTPDPELADDHAN